MAQEDESQLSQDQVVGVLAQALAITDNPDKQYTELRRVRRFLDQNSSLIPHIFGVVRPLISSHHVDTRKWYAEFLDLAIATPQLSIDSRTLLAVQCLDDLFKLLSDEHSIVKKVAIQCCASAFPIIFRHICHRPSDQSHWQMLNAIKRKIMEAWEDRNEGVKVSVCKFVQKTILVQSRAIADPRLQNRNDISLNICPMNHPYVKPSGLEQEGMALLDVLLRTLHTATSPNLLTAIINSGVILFKLRPSLQEKIVQSILSWTPANLANTGLSQIRSVEKSLRIHMNNILKTGFGGNYVPQLHQAMQQQAARMEIIMKAARDGAETRKRKLEAEQSERHPEDMKRNRVNAASLIGLLPQDSPLASFDVTSLPLNLVVDCTIATLISIAPEALDAAIKSAQARLNQVDDTGFNSAPSTDAVPTEILDIKQEAPGEDEDEDELDFELETINKRLQQHNEERGVTNEQLPVIEEDKTIPPSSPVTLEDMTAAFEYKRFELPLPPTLSEEEKQADRVELIQNLIEAGPSFLEHEIDGEDLQNRRRQLASLDNKKTSVLVHMTAGDTSFQKWLFIMIRLATQEFSTHSKTIVKVKDEMKIDAYLLDPIRQALFDFVMEDFKERMSAALTWMNEEWFRGTNSSMHYNIWLEKILDRLIPTLDSKDKTFPRFLLNLPSLPDSALSQLKSVCIDPDRMQLGFSTLRLLINLRPPLRSSCVEVLLVFCTDKDKSTRSAAIITVKKWYPENQSLSGRIKDYASREFYKIATAVIKEDENAPANEPSTWTEAELARHIELYFVLCTKNQDLLEEIFPIYMQCTPQVQKVIRKQLGPVAKAIGKESTKLRQLVLNMKNATSAIAVKAETQIEEPASPAQINGKMELEASS